MNSRGQTPQNRCKRPVCALLPVCASDLPRSYLYETMAPARRHIHRGCRPSREAGASVVLSQLESSSVGFASDRSVIAGASS